MDKKNIITIKFNNYIITILMVFCSLYPFIMAATRLVRVQIGRPAYFIPVILFGIGRILSYIEDNDDDDKYVVKFRKIKVPIKILSIPVPFIVLIANFSFYTKKAPFVFLIELVIMSLFYFLSLLSKKSAKKMLKLIYFIIGLVIGALGFYINFLFSPDIAILISIVCLAVYCIGLLMISTGELKINKNAIKNAVKRFLNFIKHLLRTVSKVMSPKENFIRLLTAITRKKQKENLYNDDIVESVAQSQIVEDISDERPNYHFKNIRKIVDIIKKIRYSYAYTLYTMYDNGIEIEGAETILQLKARIKEEYDEDEQEILFNDKFDELTDVYEIVRYAERLPEKSEYKDIETNVKFISKLIKKVQKRRSKK